MTWNITSKPIHKLGWLPGLPGKGFVWSPPDSDPVVHTWNVAENGPNHHDMLEHHYIPYREMKSPFDIADDGTVTVPQEWEPTFNSTTGFNLGDLNQVDPNLRFLPQSEWEEPDWQIS